MKFLECSSSRFLGSLCLLCETFESMSSSSPAPPLSQGAGYGVIIGLGAFFAIVSWLRIQ